MKRIILVMLSLLVLAGCGRKDEEPAEATTEAGFSSPTQVVEGIMHAYKTRNDSLYAALLADDFRYYFEPVGADSADILGWGKNEEVVATGNLFRTPDVDSLSYRLYLGNPRPAHGDTRQGWMIVPISGGKMVVMVRAKEPMEVQLNRQEIVLRPEGDGWRIVEWHDFPEGDSGGEE
jgi:hypothetical protein